jgi:NitT/TauT family transport system substrate-binding protein
LLNGINRGLELRVVASMSYNPDASQLSPSALLVGKDLWDNGTVRSPADLRGRRVAVNALGGVVEYQVNKGLERGGITARDVELVPLPFPDMPLALRNGAVDGGLMPDPFSTIAREQGAAATLVANPAPELLVTMLQFGPNLLARDREPAAQAFLRALRRAGNELLDPAQITTDEHVAIWVKHSGVQEALIRKTALYRFARDLAVDAGSLLDQQRYLVQQGRLEYDTPLPEDRLVDWRLAVRK